MASETLWLAFGPRSAAVRRSVGRVAWVVLKELVLDAGCRQRDALVETSTRSLAADLALAKDVVASALRGLAEMGLLERDGQRRSDAGQFGSGQYRLDERALADVLIVIARGGHAERRRDVSHGQGRLFERGAPE